MFRANASTRSIGNGFRYQRPFLKKKFLSYTDFSKISSIEELTGKKENQVLEVKQLSELRSMVYWNKETRFEPRPLPSRAQMSTIEDFYLDADSIVYVGNYLDFVNELGQSTGNSGGSLTLNADMNLKQTGDLNLPHGLNTRRITKLSDHHFLVLSNNDKSYIVGPSSNKKKPSAKNYSP